MKRKNRFTIFGLAFIVLAIFAACGQPSGQKSSAPEFNDPRLTAAYSLYVQLKDALVASDAGKARTAAAAMQEGLKELPGSEEMVRALTVISGASDLAAQRVAFSELSNALAERAKASQVTEGEIYLAFCPMAADNTGAYWLASEKEIRNPYFGEQMLKCGEVKETLAP